MPRLAVPQTESTPKARRRLSSCDDPQPLHFPVEPKTVNHRHNRYYERGERAGNVERRAFHEIDPVATNVGPQRQQRRESDENNMESFKRHLAKDRVIVPRK